MAQCKPSGKFTAAPEGLEWDPLTGNQGTFYLGAVSIGSWSGQSVGSVATTIATTTSGSRLEVGLSQDGSDWTFVIPGHSYPASRIGFEIQAGEALMHCNWFAMARLLQDEIGSGYAAGRMNFQYAIRIIKPPQYMVHDASLCV